MILISKYWCMRKNLPKRHQRVCDNFWGAMDFVSFLAMPGWGGNPFNSFWHALYFYSSFPTFYVTIKLVDIFSYFGSPLACTYEALWPFNGQLIFIIHSCLCGGIPSHAIETKIRDISIPGLVLNSKFTMIYVDPIFWYLGHRKFPNFGTKIKECGCENTCKDMELWSSILGKFQKGLFS